MNKRTFPQMAQIAQIKEDCRCRSGESQKISQAILDDSPLSKLSRIGPGDLHPEPPGISTSCAKNLPAHLQ
ncbi:MAG TPA: hypothetical protein DCG57_03315 [Candidatus Riflebacteria bacterium]|nr:hypothetical protein [Candidatus Riflebacteria bacterium]